MKTRQWIVLALLGCTLVSAGCHRRGWIRQRRAMLHSPCCEPAFGVGRFHHGGILHGGFQSGPVIDGPIVDGGFPVGPGPGMGGPGCDCMKPGPAVMAGPIDLPVGPPHGPHPGMPPMPLPHGSEAMPAPRVVPLPPVGAPGVGISEGVSPSRGTLTSQSFRVPLEDPLAPW